MSDTAGLVRRLSSGLLNVVLPPRCLACGEAVAQAGALCAGCWDRIDFIAPPFCACCGLPFEFDPGPETLCGACLRDRPAYDRARSVMRYDEVSKGLILRFKHADRTDGAPAFGSWLARAGGELLAEADLLAPVPLHWRRLWQRRYNQAALLCHALGRAGDRPVVAGLLVRRRATPSQGRRNRAERRHNVRGAFALAPQVSALCAGKRVLLVDDVMTTGATVEACAKALIEGGVAAVDVLTLARVVRPQGE